MVLPTHLPKASKAHTPPQLLFSHTGLSSRFRGERNRDRSPCHAVPDTDTDPDTDPDHRQALLRSSPGPVGCWVAVAVAVAGAGALLRPPPQSLNVQPSNCHRPRPVTRTPARLPFSFDFLGSNLWGRCVWVGVVRSLAAWIGCLLGHDSLVSHSHSHSHSSSPPHALHSSPDLAPASPPRLLRRQHDELVGVGSAVRPHPAVVGVSAAAWPVQTGVVLLLYCCQPHLLVCSSPRLPLVAGWPEPPHP